MNKSGSLSLPSPDNTEIVNKVRKKFSRAWNEDAEWFERNKTVDLLNTTTNNRSPFKSKTLRLNDTEMKYLTERFGTTGAIDVSQIVVAFELTNETKAAKTEIDIADKLPQPYRMITKLIEQEIMDKAWLEIVRRHPEVEVDSDGQTVPLRRNHMLQTSIKCDKMVSIPTSHFASVSASNGVVYATDSDGLFHVLSPENFESLNSMKIFVTPDPALVDPENLNSEDNAPLAVTTPGTYIPTTFPRIAGVCTPTVHIKLDSIVQFQGRFAIASIVTELSMPVEDVPAKKPAKNAAPVVVEPLRTHSFRVLVVDVFRAPFLPGAQPSYNTRYVYSMLPVHDIRMDKVSDKEMDNLDAALDCLSVNFSTSGESISIVTQGLEGGFWLYELAAIAKSEAVFNRQQTEEQSTVNIPLTSSMSSSAVVPDASPATAEIPVDSNVVAAEEEVPVNAPPINPLLDLKPALCIAQLENKHNGVFQHGMVQSVIQIPIKAPIGSGTDGTSSPSKPKDTAKTRPISANKAPRKVPEVTPPAVTNEGINTNTVDKSKELELQNVYEKLTLVVVMRDAPQWYMMGLQKKPVEAPNAGIVPDPKAKSKAKPTDTTPAVVEKDPNTPVYSAYCLASWTLTANVSAHAVDEKRQLLVLGQTDGTVTLWSILDRALVKVLAQHPSYISSLVVYVENTTAMMDGIGGGGVTKNGGGGNSGNKQQQYKKSVHIVSGSFDGTLCFYASTDGKSINNNSSNSGGNNNGNMAMTMMMGGSVNVAGKGASAAARLVTSNSFDSVGLVDYRNDIPNSAVVQIRLVCNPPSGWTSSSSSSSGVSKPSLLTVQYSCTTVAVYNFRTCDLIGKLNTMDRINYVSVQYDLQTRHRIPGTLYNSNFNATTATTGNDVGATELNHVTGTDIAGDEPVAGTTGSQIDADEHSVGSVSAAGHWNASMKQSVLDKVRQEGVNGLQQFASDLTCCRDAIFSVYTSSEQPYLVIHTGSSIAKLAADNRVYILKASRNPQQSSSMPTDNTVDGVSLSEYVAGTVGTKLLKDETRFGFETRHNSKPVLTRVDTADSQMSSNLPTHRQKKSSAAGAASGRTTPNTTLRLTQQRLEALEMSFHTKDYPMGSNSNNNSSRNLNMNNISNSNNNAYGSNKGSTRSLVPSMKGAAPLSNALALEKNDLYEPKGMIQREIISTKHTREERKKKLGKNLSKLATLL